MIKYCILRKYKHYALRSWENKGTECTGFTIDQEKAFRILVINTIFENEKSQYGLNLTLTKEFTTPKKQTALDLEANLDYSFIS
jgi:hypothetical protein